MFASTRKTAARNLATAAMSLFAAGCLSQPAPGDSADPQTADGQRLLKTYCAACHAVGRLDHSRHPDAPAFRTLSRMYPVSGLEESLAEGIMVGHPDMPEIRFSARDVEAIISYLESIQEQ